MVATLLVVLAFVVIAICGIYIALHARDTFGFLLASGITFLISLQAAINIGVVTSALPNKGLPLPFISYGGSNLLAMLTCVGILFSVARHAPRARKNLRIRRRPRRQSFRRQSNMSASATKPPFVAIACGGTGGHLFPGLAVAGQLQKRGCDVALLISPKDVDQQAVKSAHGMEIFTLPAVGLQNRNYFSFARSFWQSWRAREENFSGPPAAGRSGDGRIHQRAAGSGREKIWRENFPARIQHHSRQGQSFSRALCGRGIRRVSRSRFAIEGAQKFP